MPAVSTCDIYLLEIFSYSSPFVSFLQTSHGPLPALHILSLFSSSLHAYVHFTHTFIFILSPCIPAHMTAYNGTSIFSWLTSWQWTNTWCALPWGRGHLSPSQLYSVACSSLPGVEASWAFPNLFGMFLGVLHIQLMFGQSHW